MSKNNKKKHSKPFHNRDVSPKVKELGKRTSHGFQEFGSLEDLDEFFRTDPDELPGAYFEPPMIKKAAPGQLSRSEGKRQ